MHGVFINAQGNLRNGWWMLAFIALVAATRPVYGPVSRGLTELGVADIWKEPLSFVFILAVTWICTRLRGERLSSVGLGISARHGVEFLVGLTAACLAISAIVAGMVVIGDVRFSINAYAGLSTISAVFYVFLFAVLLEELLFRGFLFQRMIAGTNVVVAQLVFAALFAAGHWSNPGMDAQTQILGALDIGLGAIVFGLAYVRTGRLALPVGLHLGWNWMQGAIFGFNVSGHPHEGLFVPALGDAPAWINGGGFGPEATIFAVAVDLVLIAMLWRWKGSERVSALESDQEPRSALATA